jgi:prevent-host-death family protein
MDTRTIPQRELRNNIGEILREAEAGTEFTITVRGRPVARLGPAERPRVRTVDVDPDTVLAILANTPVDNAFRADIDELRRREDPIDDPWKRA